MSRHALAASVLVVLALAVLAGCSEDPPEEIDPNRIPCRDSSTCPPSKPFCVNNICIAPAADPDDEVEADTDGDTDPEPDGPELDLVVCEFPCCTNDECIPPNQQPGDPPWVCESPGTRNARCRQVWICPAEFECCDSAKCVELHGCPSWECRKADGADGGTCINTVQCSPGAQRCSIPRPDDPASYGRYEVCTEDAAHCLSWVPNDCAHLMDCEEDVHETIECVYSGRCEQNSDCIENFECRDTPNGKRCQLKIAPRCGQCVNGVDAQGYPIWVAECDPESPVPLGCCIDQQTNIGICDEVDGQGQCTGACTTR